MKIQIMFDNFLNIKSVKCFLLENFRTERKNSLKFKYIIGCSMAKNKTTIKLE